MTSLGLYIHIPFCSSKCYYCDFSSAPWSTVSEMDRYVQALIQEMDQQAPNFQNAVVDTIFIGGGTPSCLEEKQMQRIIEHIRQCFTLQLDEFTIEVNPGSADTALFQAYHALDVNRISMGLQCANDDILQTIGRKHTTQDFITTFQSAQNAGFKNISVDIMSGLPGQTTDDIQHSIYLANQMMASHISLYTLKVEDNTPLSQMVQSRRVLLPTEDQEYANYHSAIQYLRNLGYQRYEISNFAKNDTICQHNMKYWTRQPYLGLGASAASFYDHQRYTNLHSRLDYVKAIENQQPFIDQTEFLSPSDEAFEMLMLSSRLSIGMSYQHFNEKYQVDFRDVFHDQIHELMQKSYIQKTSDTFILTDQGMDLQNQILVSFLDAWHHLFPTPSKK